MRGLICINLRSPSLKKAELFSLRAKSQFSLDGIPAEWYTFSMPISLPPDLDARIQQKVARAGYRSPDEVIRKALDALDATEQQEAPPPAKGKKGPAVPLWQRFQTAGRSIRWNIELIFDYT